jgi:MATE family multidrug resistance protein
MGIFFMVVILITKDYFAIIFTSSVALRQAVSKLAFLLGVTMVLNSVQPVISGILLFGLLLLLCCKISLSFLFFQCLLESFLQALLLEVGGKRWWLISTWVVITFSAFHLDTFLVTEQIWE